MDITTDKFRVIIAEDHHIFADGIEQIVSSMPGYEVVAKVGNGKLLMQTLNSISADLLLLDINMPYMDGLEAAKAVRLRMPTIKIVFISMYYDSGMTSFARQHGIQGFISKSIMAPDLKNALQEVMGGGTSYIMPETPRAEFAGPQDELSRKFSLSARELEVVGLIREGNSTKQISDILHLSAFTVETHRKNIYRKLQVKNMAELVALTTRYDR